MPTFFNSECIFCASGDSFQQLALVNNMVGTFHANDL